MISMIDCLETINITDASLIWFQTIILEWCLWSYSDHCDTFLRVYKFSFHALQWKMYRQMTNIDEYSFKNNDYPVALYFRLKRRAERRYFSCLLLLIETVKPKQFLVLLIRPKNWRKNQKRYDWENRNIEGKIKIDLIEKIEGWYFDFETKIQATKSYVLLCLYKTHNTTRWLEKMSCNEI